MAMRSLVPTPSVAATSPAVLIAMLASATERIRLGTGVTVLSSDDPIRVYERFATLNAVSGGRAEVILGRGSFTESFPLFGYDLADYDDLFAEKLDLLLQLRDECLQPRLVHAGRQQQVHINLGLQQARLFNDAVGVTGVALTKLDGSPLGDGTFRLCTSNYRATGTGGYEILRKCPVLWRGGVEMPDLTARYIQTHSPVSVLKNAEMRVIW